MKKRNGVERVRAGVGAGPGGPSAAGINSQALLVLYSHCLQAPAVLIGSGTPSKKTRCHHFPNDKPTGPPSPAPSLSLARACLPEEHSATPATLWNILRTRVIPLDAARSLYGHLLVQWSPFFPQILHTRSDVFAFAIAWSGSWSFSISLLLCTRTAGDGRSGGAEDWG